MIFIGLIGVLSWILLKRKINNRYTKYAYLELIVALAFRTVSCIVLAAKHKSTKLNTRLFDEFMLQIPYYLVVQVSFSMLFGWITLRATLQGVVNDNSYDNYEVMIVTQKRYLCIYTVVVASVYIFLVFDFARGLMTYDGHDTAPNGFDYLVFTILLIFHLILIGLYIWVYWSLRRLLTQIEEINRNDHHKS